MNAAAQIVPVVGCGEPAGEGALPAPSSAVSFTLPEPPSVNAMFKNTKHGRAKTEAYRDWQMVATVALRRQHVPPVHGRVIVIIGIERKSESADIDNRLKAVLDILTSTHGLGVIDDDRFVTAILVSWLPKANGLAHVQLLPVQSLTAQFHPAPNGASGAWMIEAPLNEGEQDGREPE